MRSKKWHLTVGTSHNAITIGGAGAREDRLPVWVDRNDGRGVTATSATAVLGGLSFPVMPTALERREHGAVLAPLLVGELGGGIGKVEKHGAVDPDLLRSALLFNEKVDVPHIRGGGMTISCLEMSDDLMAQTGLRRHEVQALEGGLDLSSVSYSLWRRNEDAAPGRWTIWHDENVDPLPDLQAEPALALKLRLQRAIIVPHRSVPLDEVINFREARKSELRSLRLHLEEIGLEVIRSGGDPQAARLAVDRFELELENYLNAAKQANWKKSLFGFDVKFSLTDAFKGAFEAWPAVLVGHELKSSVLAGLAVGGNALRGGLTIERTVGAPETDKPRPFAYVAHVAHDL